jgi:hypothetical protein
VQYLQVNAVLPPGPAMTAAIDNAKSRIAAETAAWGACHIVEPIGGDGVSATSLALACDKGNLVASLTLDESGQIKQLTLSPGRDQACVP